MAGAKARGLDVTAEAYPYIAGMTSINSALFNPGWQEKFGIGYDSLMLPETGERLTKERFDELHASPKSQGVVLFVNRQEVVDGVIANPLTSIASDGETGHPRNAGTYSMILARYVRELRHRQLDRCNPQDELDAGATARESHRVGAVAKEESRKARTRISWCSIWPR